MNAKKFFKSTVAMIMASLVIAAGGAAAVTSTVDAGTLTASAISVHDFQIKNFKASNPYGGQLKNTSPVDLTFDLSEANAGPYNTFMTAYLKIQKDGVEYVNVNLKPGQTSYRFNPVEAGTYTAQIYIIDYYGNRGDNTITFYVKNRDDVNIKKFEIVPVYGTAMNVSNSFKFNYEIENALKCYDSYTCAYIEVMKDGVQHGYIDLNCANPNTKWFTAEHGYYTAKLTMVDYYGRTDVRTIGFSIEGRASDAHIEYLHTVTPSGKLTVGTPIKFAYDVTNAYTNYDRYTCAAIDIRQGGKTSKDGTVIDTVDVNVDKDKSTWVWTPKAAGKYILVFNFTDGYRHSDVKSIAIEVGEALKASASVSRTNMDVGQTVKVTASASKGAGNYQYTIFSKKSTENTWKTIKACSPTNYVNYAPTSAGTYQFKIQAKDANGKIVNSSVKTVTVKSKLVNNSKISATTAKVNKALTVTGAASGGSGSYQYAVAYRLSTASSYTTVRNFSTTKTASVKFASAGKYIVRVAVKDSNNNTVYKYLTVNVTK